MWKIGPRLWKTGLAVAITIALLRYIGHPAEFGAIAAALAVAPSAGRSFRFTLRQTGANLLGGLVGSLAVFLFGANPIVIGLTVIFMLWLCGRMQWQDISGAVITIMIFVMAPHQEGASTYALWRVLSAATGALIGTVVNALIMPPDYWPQLIETLTAAGERLDGFVLAIAERLDHPAAYTKAEILAGAGQVEKAIAEARRISLLLGESTRGGHMAAPKPVVERTVKVLESLLERILVIHKAALMAEQAHRYHTELPAMQAALQELVTLRRALYGRLWGEEIPATLAVELQSIERTFETPTGLPGRPEEVEPFFRLHRMRSGISYMANRLGRLQVAIDGAAPVPETEALMLPVGGD
ncbi:MAG TPA: aromatic acid exporter family protein [Symbiobacteriaceae bacterium]|jgi:hypothetical protein